jgi:mannose-1-phosphate guanylyltransferase
MLEHTYAVIMAGGGGTRLWPVSRRKRPKQLLPLVEKRSLFQSTVDRLRAIFPPERIFVVTVAEQLEAIREQAPMLLPQNLLVEPVPRGTASVVGLAAAVLARRDPQAMMAILPSDHFIRNGDLFALLLRVAFDVAEAGYLVTLGITPTYPATVYGYIQRGEPLPETFFYPAYRVLRFKEKPSEAEARQMILSGDYSWNSGMFIWRADRILEEIARYMPELKRVLDEILADWDTSRRQETLERLWPTLDTETIDYGVMEYAERVAVLPASDLGWSDIGNWDSLFNVLLPDEQGNIVFGGNHLPLDTSNSLVYGNHDGRLIVTIGVDGLIVVDSGDALLICRKDQAPRVRQVVEYLKQHQKEEYL